MSEYSRRATSSISLTLTLLFWKNLPSGHNNVVEYLQTQVYNLSALSNLPARGFARYKHFVCGYVASCKILSTSSHASGSSLNCCGASADVESMLRWLAQVRDIPGSELPVQLFAVCERVSKCRRYADIVMLYSETPTCSPRPS